MHAPRRPTTIGSLSLLAGLIGFLSTAQAQDYPNRPVRLITDSAPGGSIDVPVRIIAEGLSRVWRQQAVVINQPGAGGAIAARTAATATPDGYTFGVIAASAFVALPGSADNLPVQVPRDFTPAGSPDSIVRKANADLVKTMSDPEIHKRLADLGRDDRSMSPAQVLAFIQGEQSKWAPIVQQIAAQTQNK